MNAYDIHHTGAQNMNAYVFYDNGAKTIWMLMICDIIEKSIINAYDLWHNGAQTVWSHMIYDTMVQIQKEPI